MKKYDFVVVGSGNAGMSAGITLALAGKKTLIIEKHNIPGGCASSFVRGRFEFDPSLHELCGIGSEEKPGNTGKLLKSLGVKVNWVNVDDCFRVITKYSDGTPMDVTMPAGRENFIDKMEYYVPGSRKSIEDLFELFDECSAGIDFVSSTPNYSKKEMFQKFPNMLRVGSYSSLEVFKALKIPQKAIDILSTYWSYLGVDMANLSFLHYGLMVSNYITNGAYIPKHTSHEISVAMVERFRELGGEIWFGCRAEEFIFDGDKCCGVKTNLGDIEADCVIANINPDIIYGQMMPKALIPEREMKLSAARDRKFGARMFTAYFGVNKTPEELGIKDYSYFLSGSADSVKEYDDLRRIATNEYTIFLCYNVANPGFSPDGTCVCSFTTMYTGKECKDWDSLKPEEYVRAKKEVTKKFLKTLKDKTGIDIAPYIEECTTASPMTFARYLNVPEGSVYGYETSGWDDIISRSMMLKDSFPIKGLYTTGTSGVRGDGYSSAYADGNIVANFALKKMGGNN